MVATEDGGSGARFATSSQRVLQVGRDVRELAAKLAETADDVATTLDQVARVRESRAEQAHPADALDLRRAARRARETAERERAEGRRLRTVWDLPEQ